MSTRPPVRLCDRPEDRPGAAAELAADAWAIRVGFQLPPEPWDLSPRRWACSGDVADPVAGQAAVWCLVRGCAVVLSVLAGAPSELVADLGRAGTVTRFTTPLPDAAGLTADEIALLDALARGTSTRQAAADLYLSGRTATRRLAEARRKLGVTSNREAAVAWTRRFTPPSS